MCYVVVLDCVVIWACIDAHVFERVLISAFLRMNVFGGSHVAIPSSA